MPTTIRTINERGQLVGFRVVDRTLASSLNSWRLFADQMHPVISTTERLVETLARYVYLQEQLALNAVRTGENLVDPERTRHILEGSPILRTTYSQLGDGEKTTTVLGWSGGHANPDAAQYGKTQIPDFWTEDRFMYEVSDILADDSSRWYLQEGDDFGQRKRAQEDAPPRYVCVEERYGVPIRVVAERVDDELKCVTAFPDYRPWQGDEHLRVD